MSRLNERAHVAQAAGRHALAWLVAANAVGVGMAAVLVWPALGLGLPALTYGRWVPLHLDWQLYGWCALPLVAVLWAWCADVRHPQASAHAATSVWLWSVALALGGLSWLSGVSSGKPFLEWSGWARPLLPFAMTCLWTVLAGHVWWRRRQLSAGGLGARIAVMACLAAVPTVLFWSMARTVYPSVNPDSGGATGARLLASTLGIVGIYGLLGEVLTVVRPSVRWLYWGYFVLSGFVFVRIEGGNSSHHEVLQIIGLGTLMGWVPLVGLYFDRTRLAPAARSWWMAAAAWWGILVVSGFLGFLPGVSEQLKYTNALVGHAHLAMAGLVTSANIAILVELGAVRAKSGFWLWQGSTAAMVAALLSVGWHEAEAPGELYFSDRFAQGAYLVRLAAGLGMFALSLVWFFSEGRDRAEEGGR